MKFAKKIPNYYATTGNSKDDDCTWPFLSSFPRRAIPSRQWGRGNYKVEISATDYIYARYEKGN
jgi:hypothetical protein